jgi:hypothetical protein
LNDHQEEQVTSTTRVLYPMVADRCRTKPARIERNVRDRDQSDLEFRQSKAARSALYQPRQVPAGEQRISLYRARYLQQGG